MRHVAGILNRSRSKVEAVALVPEPCEPARIEPRAARQVQHAGALLVQQLLVDPAHLRIDLLEAATRGVAVLAQVFLQHSLAERRVVPGDVVALCPCGGREGSRGHV